MSDDLDDFDFDDFDIPDLDTDGVDSPANDRNPATKVATGFLDGLSGAALDRNVQKRVIEEALPKGYGKAFTELDNAVTYGKDVYDSVADELRPAKKNLKKLGRAATSKLKGILPDSITAKLEELTSDNDDASLDNIDPVATEINSTLTEIFGAQQEEDAKNRHMAEAVEGAKFKTNMDVLNAIRVGVNRQVAYQDQIDAQVSRKALELQFKQYYTAKNQYELLEAFVKDHKVSQENIVKNTGLPDFVKTRTAEAAKEMMRERMVGKGLGKISEFTANFMPELKKNIGKKVKDMAGQVKNGINSAADSADMMGDIPTDELTMAGTMAGGLAADPLAERLGKALGGLFKDNKTIQKIGSRLEYAIDNKETLIYDAINDGSAKLVSNNIYIKGETDSVINHKELKSGRFIDLNTNRSVRSLGDITGPVSDENGNVVITNEDYEHGIVDETSKGGMFKNAMTKVKQGLGVTLKDSMSNYSSGFTVGRDALMLAEEAVPYSALTDKSITEIIPGLLSEILHEQELARTGANPSDVERRIFNFDTNKLDRESSVQSGINNKILPKALKDDIKEELTDVIDTLDPDNLLDSKSRNAFMKQLLRDASDGTKGFSIERFLSDDGLDTIQDPVVAEKIRDFLVDAFLDDSGKFNTNSVRATDLRTKTAQKFNKVKDTLPNYQEQIARVGNLYGADKLASSGFVDSQGQGDIASILAKLYGGDISFGGGSNDQVGPIQQLGPFKPKSKPKPKGGVKLDPAAAMAAFMGFTEMTNGDESGTNTLQSVTMGKEHLVTDESEIFDEYGNLGVPSHEETITFPQQPPKQDKLDLIIDRQDTSNLWLTRIHDLISGFMGGNDNNGSNGGPTPKPKPPKNPKGTASSKPKVLPSLLNPDMDVPSFDGGGRIPDGEREGGVDGKGGFYALLHPGETVHDPENPDGHKNPIRNALNNLKMRSQQQADGDPLKGRGLVSRFKVAKQLYKDLKANPALIAKIQNNEMSVLDLINEYDLDEFDSDFVEKVINKVKQIVDSQSKKVKAKASSVKDQLGEKVQEVKTRSFDGKSDQIKEGLERSSKRVSDIFKKIETSMMSLKNTSTEVEEEEYVDDSEFTVVEKLEQLRTDLIKTIKTSGGIGGINLPNMGEFPQVDLDGMIDKGKKVKEGFLSKLNIFKGKVDNKVTQWKDVYVNGNSIPSLESAKLKMGFYKDQLTGKVITSYDDITGPVVDQYGQTVISIQDLYNGLTDAEGKPAKFINNIQKETKSFYEYLKKSGIAAYDTGKASGGVVGKILGGLGQLTGFLKKTGTDIYKKGSEMPLITLRDLEIGRYKDKLTGKVITTFEEIKGEVVDENGNIIISLEDIKNSTLIDTAGKKLKINYEGIRGAIGGTFKKGMDTVSSIKNGTFGWMGKTTDFISGIYNKTLDIYVEGESTPRLRSVIMKNGGYLSKATGNTIMSIDDIDGEVTDLQGNTLIDSEDLKKDIFTSRGKKLKSLKNLIGKGLTAGKNAIVGAGKMGLKSIKKVGSIISTGAHRLAGKADGIGGFDDGSVDYLSKIFELLQERMPENNKVIGDTDGDGFVEGSWQDKLNDKKEAKAASTDTEGSEGSGGKKKGGMLAKLKAMNAARKERKAAKAENGGGKKGGGLLGKMMGAGSILASMGGSIMGGLATAGSAVASVATAGAALVSAPVLIGAAIVGSVAIGGYLAYKHLYKAPKGPLHRVRLAQYGISPDNKDRLGQVSALEDKLWPEVQFREGKAVLGKGVKDGDLYEFFGVDVNNANHVQRFGAWFTGRFKPVFLAHANTVNKLSPGSTIMDGDDNVDDELKAQYINAIKFPYSGDTPYSVSVSPFDDDESLVGTKTIQEEIDAAIADVTDGKGDASVSKVDAKVTPKALDKLKPKDAAVKPNAVSISKGNNFLGGKNTPAIAGAGKALNLKVTQLVEVPRAYTGKITALMAVRLKSYGLTSMAPDKVGTLMALERGVLLDVVVSGGRASFKSSAEPFFTKYGPIFGADVSNETDRTNWMVWFTQRFLPTLLSYCNAALRIKKDIDLSKISEVLTGPDALIVARATYQTLNSNGSTVWIVKASPWNDYVLNSNVESVFANLNTFKQVKVKDLAEDTAKIPTVAMSKGNSDTLSKSDEKVDKMVNDEAKTRSFETASINAQQSNVKKSQRNQMNSIENILNQSHDVQIEIRDLVKQALARPVVDNSRQPVSEKELGADAKAVIEDVRSNSRQPVSAPKQIVPNVNMSR